MLDFHEDNSEVVYKQHGIQHGIGVKYQILVLNSSSGFVKDSDAVKEPKGENEDKEESADTSSEQVNSRHGCFRRTKEKGPGTE